MVDRLGMQHRDVLRGRRDHAQVLLEHGRIEDAKRYLSHPLGQLEVGQLPSQEDRVVVRALVAAMWDAGRREAALRLGSSLLQAALARERAAEADEVRTWLERLQRS